MPSSAATVGILLLTPALCPQLLVSTAASAASHAAAAATSEADSHRHPPALADAAAARQAAPAALAAAAMTGSMLSFSKGVATISSTRAAQGRTLEPGLSQNGY